MADEGQADGDGEERCISLPSRSEMRRVTKEGGTGSQRCTREVFNTAYAQHMGTETRRDHPLTESTVRSAFASIRQFLYGKGKLNMELSKGHNTFRDLEYDQAGCLNKLRKSLEKNFKYLKLAENMWAADCLIKEVLRRDRKYQPRDPSKVQHCQDRGTMSKLIEEADREDMNPLSDEDKVEPQKTVVKGRKKVPRLHFDDEDEEYDSDEADLGQKVVKSNKRKDSPILNAVDDKEGSEQRETENLIANRNNKATRMVLEDRDEEYRDDSGVETVCRASKRGKTNKRTAPGKTSFPRKVSAKKMKTGKTRPPIASPTRSRKRRR